MRLLLSFFFLMACNDREKPAVAGHSVLAAHEPVSIVDTLIPNTAKVIHVFVALCDNKNQGIVPVPAGIGNGQDPANNLYWGCAGGVKGYFKKQVNWQLVSTSKDGYDGLMDFSLQEYPAKLHDNKRETIILACISKRYFREGIQQAGATPLIWSTGLMSPEAYTLEASIAGWLAQESPAQIRQRAAIAYDRYQHCGVKAASRLLVTGW